MSHIVNHIETPPQRYHYNAPNRMLAAAAGEIFKKGETLKA